MKTSVVKNNGFNPVWEQSISLPFDCVGDMLDLVFVRFAVKQEDKDDEEPLALYCTSLASLNSGECDWLNGNPSDTELSCGRLPAPSFT